MGLADNPIVQAFAKAAFRWRLLQEMTPETCGGLPPMFPSALECWTFLSERSTEALAQTLGVDKGKARSLLRSTYTRATGVKPPRTK